MSRHSIVIEIVPVAAPRTPDSGGTAQATADGRTIAAVLHGR